MEKSITTFNEGGKIANIIEKGEIALPFENVIYLQSIRVAGMYYYIKKDFVLLEGEKIKLKREPNNQYVSYAIELFTEKDEKIGYIPKKIIKYLQDLWMGESFLMER